MEEWDNRARQAMVRSFICWSGWTSVFERIAWIVRSWSIEGSCSGWDVRRVYRARRVGIDAMRDLVNQ